MPGWQVFEGDCLERLQMFCDATFDSLVVDPPAGIAFMGHDWDKDRGGRDQWVAYMEERFREALRVLKPGAYGLVWAMPRTAHWTAWALENAGFLILDKVVHLFGSGFPKSKDAALMVDKKLGAPNRGRAIPTASRFQNGTTQVLEKHPVCEYEAVTEAGAKWQGFGTALKPASEDWILVRRPLTGTIAENLLEHGVGVLNIDGCRLGPRERTDYGLANATRTRGSTYGEPSSSADFDSSKGRWPANVVLTHHEECVETDEKVVIAGDYRAGSEGRGERPSDFYAVGSESGDGKPGGATYGDEEVYLWECHPACPVRLLDEQSGELKSKYMAPGHRRNGSAGYTGGGLSHEVTRGTYGDSGPASRFYYTAKANTVERSAGLDERNPHPTVKAVALMRWLTRLITPPGGHVLDMYAGSGTTGIAAVLEGFRFTAIELDETHAANARRRIAFWERLGENAVEAERKARTQARRDEESGQIKLF